MQKMWFFHTYFRKGQKHYAVGLQFSVKGQQQKRAWQKTMPAHEQLSKKKKFWFNGQKRRLKWL
ncbi:MAG: hypothetical protein IJ250_06575 [Bacteroidales bacterium]|nr:hypothetical protein [Bacteroidales bacterium]